MFCSICHFYQFKGSADQKFESIQCFCEKFECHVLPCTVSSIQFIQSQNQNKAGGEKISWLQRMRALERSWSGWGLRTIKMIHLSKIKVSRTSRMLKFEIFWLKCFLCLHWTISNVSTAPNIEMHQFINVYCIICRCFTDDIYYLPDTH